MEPTDLTISILREIRDEIRKTNERLDQTNERLDQTRSDLSARLDQTNIRLDKTREELSRHIVESEMRTATAITSLAGTLQDVKKLLDERREMNKRVSKCEKDIRQIKQHTGM
jgi:predicted  nucleic acid-binding Zn-ribbon protein